MMNNKTVELPVLTTETRVKESKRLAVDKKTNPETLENLITSPDEETFLAALNNPKQTRLGVECGINRCLKMKDKEKRTKLIKEALTTHKRKLSKKYLKLLKNIDENYVPERKIKINKASCRKKPQLGP